MCHIKEIEEIRSENDVQTVINREILKHTSSFNYPTIESDIHQALIAKGMPDEEISYRTDQMIKDALNYAIDRGQLRYQNMCYVPRERQLENNRWDLFFALTGTL